MTTPTAGAIKAAQKLTETIFRGGSHDERIQEAARIIQEESGLAECLKACELAMEEFNDRYDGAPDAGYKWMGELMLVMEAAINKAKAITP